MARVRFSLRGLVTTVTVLLAALALAAAAGLAATTTLMERATVRLSEATEGVRAAEELEVDLLVHNREFFLGLLTGEAEHDLARQAAARRIEGWFAVARRLAVDSRERVLVEVAANDVREYLQAWQAAADRGVGAIEAYRATAASLENAYGSLDRLVDVNFEQAREALVESQRWNRVADAVGLVLSVALVLAALGATLVVRKEIYRPVLAIREAMERYRNGERGARAPPGGPRELADVAADFNELAATLERQREAQLSFLAAVAHDLRNPLSALKTGASLALPADDPERLARRQELLRRQVDRLDRMVGDLLDVSRIEAGRLDLHLAPVDLRNVVEGVVELFAGASARHPLRAELPDGPVEVTGDEARIEQVLNNLVSNAIKYSPEGGQVDVVLRREAGGAVVEVRDRGIGIAPEDRTRVFEPFRRVRARDDIPGVGLGLSVARRIVEGHGGRIGVESEPGHGSVFRVALPAPA